MMLTEHELPLTMIRDTRIFHFGTLSMTHVNVRRATRTAVLTAKEAGAVISFDPNLRPPLWNDLEEAREQMEWGISQCDVLKISDNEIEFLTGTDDFDRGAALIREKWPGIRLINVTAGPGGSYAYGPEAKVFVPGFLLGGTIETTGAGDTFCASVLNFILEHGLDALSQDDLKQMLRFANAAAYLVTTKKGAIRSMPERSQVEAILSEH
jgi:fructokinase